jgi:hypothetical protein
MKYALLVIEARDNNSQSLSKALWTLSQKIECSEDVGCEAIGLGSFLLSLSKGLGHLCHIHELAKEAGFSVRTLFFAEKPSWVISKVD